MNWHDAHEAARTASLKSDVPRFVLYLPMDGYSASVSFGRSHKMIGHYFRGIFYPAQNSATI